MVDCELCEDAVASVKCASCESSGVGNAFCKPCSDQLHGTAKGKSHSLTDMSGKPLGVVTAPAAPTPTPKAAPIAAVVPAPSDLPPHAVATIPMCDLCEDEKATIHCNTCDADYCTECCGDFHKPAKQQGHDRMKIVLDAAAATPATPKPATPASTFAHQRSASIALPNPTRIGHGRSMSLAIPSANLLRSPIAGSQPATPGGTLLGRSPLSAIGKPRLSLAMFPRSPGAGPSTGGLLSPPPPSLLSTAALIKATTPTPDDSAAAQCSVCEAEAAIRQCDECSDVFCAECDVDVHSSASKMAHQRRAVVASAPPQSQAPVSTPASNPLLSPRPSVNPLLQTAVTPPTPVAAPTPAPAAEPPQPTRPPPLVIPSQPSTPAHAPAMPPPQSMTPLATPRPSLANAPASATGSLRSLRRPTSISTTPTEDATPDAAANATGGRNSSIPPPSPFLLDTKLPSVTEVSPSPQPSPATFNHVQADSKPDPDPVVIPQSPPSKEWEEENKRLADLAAKQAQQAAVVTVPEVVQPRPAPSPTPPPASIKEAPRPTLTAPAPTPVPTTTPATGAASVTSNPLSTSSRSQPPESLARASSHSTAVSSAASGDSLALDLDLPSEPDFNLSDTDLPSYPLASMMHGASQRPSRTASPEREAAKARDEAEQSSRTLSRADTVVLRDQSDVPAHMSRIGGELLVRRVDEKRRREMNDARSRSSDSESSGRDSDRHRQHTRAHGRTSSQSSSRHDAPRRRLNEYERERESGRESGRDSGRESDRSAHRYAARRSSPERKHPLHRESPRDHHRSSRHTHDPHRSPYGHGDRSHTGDRHRKYEYDDDSDRSSRQYDRDRERRHQSQHHRFNSSDADEPDSRSHSRHGSPRRHHRRRSSDHDSISSAVPTTPPSSDLMQQLFHALQVHGQATADPSTALMRIAHLATAAAIEHAGETAPRPETRQTETEEEEEDRDEYDESSHEYDDNPPYAPNRLSVHRPSHLEIATSDDHLGHSRHSSLGSGISSSSSARRALRDARLRESAVAWEARDAQRSARTDQEEWIARKMLEQSVARNPTPPPLPPSQPTAYAWAGSPRPYASMHSPSFLAPTMPQPTLLPYPIFPSTPPRGAHPLSPDRGAAFVAPVPPFSPPPMAHSPRPFLTPPPAMNYASSPRSPAPPSPMQPQPPPNHHPQAQAVHALAVAAATAAYQHVARQLRSPQPPPSPHTPMSTRTPMSPQSQAPPPPLAPIPPSHPILGDLVRASPRSHMALYPPFAPAGTATNNPYLAQLYARGS